MLPNFSSIVESLRFCGWHQTVYAKGESTRGAGGLWRANDDGLATGIFDGLLRGLGELVRVDRNGLLDLAVGQHLHQPVALLQDAMLRELVQRELLLAELGDGVEAEDGVLHAEDVGEAALGQAAVQRHLAAFKAAHQAGARTRALTLVAAGGRLAHTRAHTATDALLVFVRLLGRLQIAEIQCHLFPRSTPAAWWPTRMWWPRLRVRNKTSRRYGRDGESSSPCRGSTGSLRARRSG